MLSLPACSFLTHGIIKIAIPHMHFRIFRICYLLFLCLVALRVGDRRVWARCRWSRQYQCARSGVALPAIDRDDRCGWRALGDDEEVGRRVEVVRSQVRQLPIRPVRQGDARIEEFGIRTRASCAHGSARSVPSSIFILIYLYLYLLSFLFQFPLTLSHYFEP